MRFVLDENMPLSSVALLQNIGHNVEHIIKTNLRGADDKDIADYSKNKKAILITKDIEFGSIILYPRGAHYGLIVVRLPNYFNGNQITKALEEFLGIIDREQLIGALTILELGKYRIRSL